jgi:hypothetical protein
MACALLANSLCLQNIQAKETIKATEAGTKYSNTATSTASKDTKNLDGKQIALLKTGVTKTESPLLTNTTEELPKDTEVNLELNVYLNSEVSNIGDQVRARVSVPVADGQKILLPAGWYVEGHVTEVVKQRRLGRNGYVTVKFDQLVSPDGSTPIPFNAELSTKENTIIACSKIIAKDTVMVSQGALAGGLLSAQLTGIPVAIASQGYSVAIGGAVGATIGLIGALKRKGEISSFYPRESMKFKIATPIKITGFNQEMVAKAKPKQLVKDVHLSIDKKSFRKSPYGDRLSKLLTLDISVDNQSDKQYSFFNIAVISESDRHYHPSPLQGFGFLKKIEAHTTEKATITFNIENSKEKLYLVLLNSNNTIELTRTEIQD